jgi:hypothetical protein
VSAKTTKVSQPSLIVKLTAVRSSISRSLCFDTFPRLWRPPPTRGSGQEGPATSCNILQHPATSCNIFGGLGEDLGMHSRTPPAAPSSSISGGGWGRHFGSWERLGSSLYFRGRQGLYYHSTLWTYLLTWVQGLAC